VIYLKLQPRVRVAFACLLAMGISWVAARPALGIVAGPAGGVVTTRPSSRPTTSPNLVPASRPIQAATMTLAEACVSAVHAAETGDFKAALRDLQSATNAGASSNVSAVITLLDKYLSRQHRMAAERSAEYDQAVARVHRSLLAEAYLPDLVREGLIRDTGKKRIAGSTTTTTQASESQPGSTDLRQAVRDVLTVYGRIENGGAPDLTSAEAVDKQRKQVIKYLAEIPPKLDIAVGLLVNDHSEYAGTFRRLVREALRQTEVVKEAWSSIDITTPARQGDAALRLSQVNDDLAQALSDLNTMVSPTPWQVGLTQAGLAKMLAGAGQDLSEADWYVAIKTIAADKGQKAMADARWYDAMYAYRGLSELEKSNKVYARKLKMARMHVRILVLYGKQPGTDGNQPVQARTTWQDLVSGVDVNMVKAAISEISSYYVVDVDCRRLGLAGLNALEVLAKTPQATETFAGLSSDREKKDFIAAVEREKQTLRDKTHVDQMDIRTSLDSLLWASQRTVKIPWPVVAVEFTEAMMDELDRFSAMIWPHEAQDFVKQTSGKFFGVGIQITKDPGEPLKVVTPLADTPAFRSGVKSGDVIVAVNGQKTDLLNLDQLIRMITGEKGTRVVLTIRRAGVAKLKDYAIIRDEIHIKTVKGWRRKSNGGWDYMIDPVHKIGYVRLTQFTSETAGDIDRVLAELSGSGVRSLILDLRFNPGGLLQSATKVANEFLQSGTLVSTKVRGTKVAEFKADKRGQYLDGDLVVLVNQYSASAAEIVSGALKDWHRGIIVGERTFGKGSVQHVITIKNGMAYLKLTAAYYYLPSGRLLHRRPGSKDWGVDPDVKVQLTPKQMRRWLDLQRKTDLLQDMDPKELDEDLQMQFKADLQLDTAVVLLRLLQLDRATNKKAA